MNRVIVFYFRYYRYLREVRGVKGVNSSVEDKDCVTFISILLPCTKLSKLIARYIVKRRITCIFK